jgi:hypothetical protein
LSFGSLKQLKKQQNELDEVISNPLDSVESTVR